MERLNPCPYCGSEVEVYEDAGSYWWKCPKCGYAPIVGFTMMYALSEYWDIITEYYKGHPEVLEEHRRQEKC